MPFGFEIFIEDLINMSGFEFDIKKTGILASMQEEMNRPDNGNSFRKVNSAIISSYYIKVENAKTFDELESVMADFLNECQINYLAYYNFLVRSILSQKVHRTAYMPAIIFPKFTLKNAMDIKDSEDCFDKLQGKIERIDSDVSETKISWEGCAIIELRKFASGLKTFKENEDYGIIFVKLGEKLEEYLSSKKVLEAEEIRDILILLDQIANMFVKEKDMKKVGNKLSRIRFRDLEKARSIAEE